MAGLNTHGIRVGFGRSGLITATILRFALDMIKYATLHFCVDEMAETLSNETKKCIT